MNGGDFGKSLLIDVLLIVSSGFYYDSSFCEIALLGFAIRMGTLVNTKEEKNQSNQENDF